MSAVAGRRPSSSNLLFPWHNAWPKIAPENFAGVIAGIDAALAGPRGNDGETAAVLEAAQLAMAVIAVLDAYGLRVFDDRGRPVPSGTAAAILKALAADQELHWRGYGLMAPTTKAWRRHLTIAEAFSKRGEPGRMLAELRLFRPVRQF
ncbi:MAG: hypothetical protein R3F24_05155 [Gammaproteobacteria bacterium]